MYFSTGGSGCIEKTHLRAQFEHGLDARQIHRCRWIHAVVRIQQRIQGLRRRVPLKAVMCGKKRQASWAITGVETPLRRFNVSADIAHQ